MAVEDSETKCYNSEEEDSLLVETLTEEVLPLAKPE
jgi:hypothetical protein